MSNTPHNTSVNVKKNVLSKSDLLKGKLDELTISNFPNEGDSSIVYLGPLRTGTALALFKRTSKISNNPDKPEDANLDLITEELSAAISEALVDESGTRILSPEDVINLPLEIYPLIANAVMNKVNQSLLKFNKSDDNDTAGEVPLDGTVNSSSPTDLQEN